MNLLKKLWKVFVELEWLGDVAIGICMPPGSAFAKKNRKGEHNEKGT